MDCPHCGTENLVGASRCAACGKAMVSAPKFAPRPQVAEPQPVTAGARGADDSRQLPRPSVRSRSDELFAAPAAAPLPSWGGGPGAAPPLPEPDGPAQSMCRICRAPFEHAVNATGDEASVCSSCRSLARDVAQMAPSEVQIAPATGASATEGFAARASSDRRPRPVTQRKVGLRTGPVTAVVGLVLVLVGLAVTTIARRDTDRTKALLADVQTQPAQIAMTPGVGSSIRIRTTVQLEATRDDARSFGGTTSRVLDLRQRTVQQCEATVVRTDDQGPVLDVVAEGRVAEQSGTSDSGDAREASLYPFQGPHGTVRVRAHPSAALAQLDGESVSPGRHVPPLAHLGALGATSKNFQVGDRWKADVTLPGLTDRQGRLIVCAFPVEVTYVGSATHGGLGCAAFRVTGRLPQRLPGPTGEEFNRATGRVVGAVWIERATGLVAGADVEVEARLARETGRLESELRVATRLLIERK